MRDYPDVVRVEIEYDGGTVRIIEGDEAQKWADYMDAGMGLLGTRPSMAPEPPDPDAWTEIESDSD